MSDNSSTLSYCVSARITDEESGEMFIITPSGFKDRFIVSIESAIYEPVVAVLTRTEMMKNTVIKPEYLDALLTEDGNVRTIKLKELGVTKK